MGLAEYLNQSKKIIKEKSMKQCKLAILSNFTISGLGETLRVFFHKYKIYAETYTADYNQNAQEI